MRLGADEGAGLARDGNKNQDKIASEGKIASDASVFHDLLHNISLSLFSGDCAGTGCCK